MQASESTLLEVKEEIVRPLAKVYEMITNWKFKPVHISWCQSNITALSINLSNRSNKLTLRNSCDGGTIVKKICPRSSDLRKAKYRVNVWSGYPWRPFSAKTSARETRKTCRSMSRVQNHCVLTEILSVAFLWGRFEEKLLVRFELITFLRRGLLTKAINKFILGTQ